MVQSNLKMKNRESLSVEQRGREGHEGNFVKQRRNERTVAIDKQPRQQE